MKIGPEIFRRLKLGETLEISPTEITARSRLSAATLDVFMCPYFLNKESTKSCIYSDGIEHTQAYYSRKKEKLARKNKKTSQNGEEGKCLYSDRNVCVICVLLCYAKLTF